MKICSKCNVEKESVYYGLVYKVTNKINGKVYIGQTVQRLEKRIRTHIRDARVGSTAVFHKAIRKYGENNFTYQAIDYAHSANELTLKEMEWVDKENTFVDSEESNGYNMIDSSGYSPKNYIKNIKIDKKMFLSIIELCKRGESSIDDITSIFNLSRSSVFYIFDENSRTYARLNDTVSEKDFKVAKEKFRLLNYERGLETISKLKSKGRHHFWNISSEDNPLSKKVYQINLKTEKVVGVFHSATDAAKHVGAYSTSNIARVCRGERNKGYGFGWVYEKDYLKEVSYD